MKVKKKSLLNLLSENVAQKQALDRICAVIQDRREDEHGNSESRGDWMDRIISETRAALKGAGYDV